MSTYLGDAIQFHSKMFLLLLYSKLSLACLSFRVNDVCQKSLAPVTSAYEVYLVDGFEEKEIELQQISRVQREKQRML